MQVFARIEFYIYVNMKLSERFSSLLEGAVERSETEEVKQITSSFE